MGISLKTSKMLWGRSGNMCAFPDCKKELVVDATQTDDESIVGEEAHIVARKEDGPRGKSELTSEQRDKYNNLILMCNIHHKIIDDQPLEYTVEKLHEFKTSHENWVRDNLRIDRKKIRDDELYADYFEHFIKLTDLHNWNIWTSWLLGSSQSFHKDIFESLQKVPDYIVSRIWPKRYADLEMAFVNFKSVLNDLMRVYHEYPEEYGESNGVEKFYKAYNHHAMLRNGRDFDPELEHKMVEKYNYHIALLEDLILELTRAANYICDKFRDHIFEGFRLSEGALLVTRGDILGYQTYRVEYRGEERIEHPYPGLRKFMEVRNNRDLTIGTGIEEDYFRKLPWDQ